jgi:hypothetical protein
MEEGDAHKIISFHLITNRARGAELPLYFGFWIWDCGIKNRVQGSAFRGSGFFKCGNRNADCGNKKQKQSKAQGSKYS